MARYDKNRAPRKVTKNRESKVTPVENETQETPEKLSNQFEVPPTVWNPESMANQSPNSSESSQQYNSQYQEKDDTRESFTYCSDKVK